MNKGSCHKSVKVVISLSYVKMLLFLSQAEAQSSPHKAELTSYRSWNRNKSLEAMYVVLTCSLILSCFTTGSMAFSNGKRSTMYLHQRVINTKLDREKFKLL